MAIVGSWMSSGRWFKFSKGLTRLTSVFNFSARTGGNHKDGLASGGLAVSEINCCVLDDWGWTFPAFRSSVLCSSMYG